MGNVKKTYISYIGKKTDRIDKLLALLFPGLTRSYIQTLCSKEKVVHNGKNANKKSLVEYKDEIHIFFPQEKLDLQPEKIDLDIIFENDDFAVINKDPFINVHPVSGENGMQGTLVNGLLHHFWDLSVINGVERPGIVHRLDKETSWLILIAKTTRQCSNSKKCSKKKK